MDLGFFTMPIHPLDKDWRQCLREDREAFILADELGFTEAYVGEHATDKAENVTSCTMFLASLADATKQIKLGTGTINMPNSHPVAIASQIAMLDHLLDGRLLFGISPGGLLSDAEAFENLDADRNEMFLESINQVLEIWASEPPYNISGKYWNISTEKTLFAEVGQGILGKPLQRPHPPIIVAVVAPFSKGVTEAAARGWDPISANFLLPKWTASHWPKYVEGCERADRPVSAKNWRIARSIFVADDEATAKSYARDPGSPYRYYFEQFVLKLIKAGRSDLIKRDRSAPDSSIDIEDVMDQLVFHGTPDKVAEQILAFREETGDFGVLTYAGHDWVDRNLARRSMVLMAEQVLPKVNEAIGDKPRQNAAQ